MQLCGLKLPELCPLTQPYRSKQNDGKPTLHLCSGALLGILMGYPMS